MSERRRVRVLVTGFGAFPGAPVNPTEALTRRLEQRQQPALRRAGAQLHTAVLPVIFDEAEKAIDQLLARHAPDIVLHLGLAARRPAVSVETRAINRLTAIHPDASGAHATTRPVTPGGPDFRSARWPAAQIAASMSRLGVRAAISRDAGAYLCNQVLYLSLARHRGPCGFVHVPLLRARRRKQPHAQELRQRPTMEQVERALVASIRQLVTAWRREQAAR